MTVFILNSDNLRYMKVGMQRMWPHLRASHRVQAFAAALGYRTYEALRADLQLNDASNPPVLCLDAPGFAKRVLELSEQIIEPKALIELAHSSTMPLRPWIEFKNGDHSENDRWFRECRQRDIPFVYIKRRRKYVELNWDCISQDPRHDGRIRGSGLVKEMFHKFQAQARGAQGKPMFFGSSFVGTIDNLLPDTARRLADDFFVALMKPIKTGSASQQPHRG